MSTENEQHKAPTLELDGQYLTGNDCALLVRMLPDCCCAKCKHWEELGGPEWPAREVHFWKWYDGKISYFSTLYYEVDWEGECRRFPPKVVPPEETPTHSVWGWPITSCRDHCGEFAPQEQPIL